MASPIDDMMDKARRAADRLVDEQRAAIRNEADDRRLIGRVTGMLAFDQNTRATELLARTMEEISRPRTPRSAHPIADGLLYLTRAWQSADRPRGTDQ